MVEVFKTNIRTKSQARKVKSKIIAFHSDHKVNFDLEDCDRILRVECDNLLVEDIISLVDQEGFTVALLEDRDVK